MIHGLSSKARRTTRRLRRRRAGELNIVSMIDILTVLVFFLLVNQIGVSILGVNLPESSATPPKEPPKMLSLILRSQSLILADRNGPIKELPAVVGADGQANAYDLNALTALLSQLKDHAPDENKITLLLEPGIAYDALVQVMDAVRSTVTPDGRAERELFPAISLGDAPAAASDPAVKGGAP